MWKYQVWKDGCCLHETDYDFDSEIEALDSAHRFLDGRFNDWKSDGCYNNETYDDFDIKTDYEECCKEGLL